MVSSNVTSHPMRTGIVIATKGRPRATTNLLKLLERQTMRPSIVVISATTRTDIEGDIVTPLNVEYLFGAAGTCSQRNRALNEIRSACDIVVFFDDDFAPSSRWIEHCVRVFQSDAGIVGVSGAVLRDGARMEEISWEEANRLIEADTPLGSPVFTQQKDLYGCNMAFRLRAVGDASFDERLVLYGWMEDADFSRTVGRAGRLVQSDSMVGVHLGIRSGRVSGRRYGYSQVVNPWYLYKKGSLSAREAWSKVLRPVSMNAVKAIRPEKHIDRLGRFGGNVIGIGHLLAGSCRPEAAADL
jgi:GT2 family glycosyltransferase